MESRLLPVFFLLLARIPSVVVATDNDGSGNGGHGQDPVESSSLRPENECRIPPYSDPGRIQESAVIDKERLLFQGRCFLACASHLEESKVKRISDISVYWPTMKVKKSCVVERMVHECVRGCTLPSRFGDGCPQACFDDCISECGGSTNNECDNPDQHEPWIRSTCIIKCASNIKNEANSCRVGCNKATTLRSEASEVGVPPKDPTGPPSLNWLETSTVGQFSISFSNAAPAQPRGDNRAVNATPVAFLLRLEETMSHNVSYIWLPNPLQQNPMVLDLADYACQQLSVSFAVINTAGLSNFSVPQIINMNGDDRRIPSPPTNIQPSTEIDARHGFFGHVILNISWEAPQDGAYLDNYTITVSPARGVDSRCGNESWSATVLPGQTSISVMAESEDSLPVMDCTYYTMIYATGLDGNSDSLTDSLLMPKFDPDCISFTCERRWDSSENLFWFHLTWTLPPYLFDWNNISYLHGFYVFARMIDGRGSVIDSFSSPQIQVPLQQNNPVTFALTYHDTLKKSYHYPQHERSWQYFIESFPDWNMENLLFTPDLNKQNHYTSRASVRSPAPSVVTNVTVVSYEIQKHEIVLNLTWYPPSTANGVLASYKICAGEDPLQPDEVIGENSRRHHCHEDLNVTTPNAINVTLINVAQYCLFVQIRANNQYTSGNWSQPFIIRFHPSGQCTASPASSPDPTSASNNSSSISISSSNQAGAIAGALLGTLVAIALFLFSVFLIVMYMAMVIRRKRLLRITQEPCDDPMFSSGQRQLLLHRPIQSPLTSPQRDEWEIPPNEVIIEDCLGEGAFGEVYKGIIKCPIVNPKVRSSVKNAFCTPVAIKLLKLSAKGGERQDFLSEIEMMKKVAEGQNPHVVGLLGCVTIQEPLCLITEFIKYGDLLSYLKTNRRMYTGSRSGEESSSDAYTDLGNVSPMDLISFAYQIASGMEYLSSLGIVHRDLACRNILVDEGKVLKITDFGMSRETDEIYVQKRTGRVPLKWMAIESIIAREFTSASDVWSYGIVLWEIGTLGGFPYPSIQNEDLLSLLKRGYRMEKPDNCSTEVYDVMLMCWNEEPHKRPKFTELRSRFDAMLLAERKDAYIDLRIDSDKPYYRLDTMTTILANGLHISPNPSRQSFIISPGLAAPSTGNKASSSSSKECSPKPALHTPNLSPGHTLQASASSCCSLPQASPKKSDIISCNGSPSLSSFTHSPCHEGLGMCSGEQNLTTSDADVSGRDRIIREGTTGRPVSLLLPGRDRDHRERKERQKNPYVDEPSRSAATALMLPNGAARVVGGGTSYRTRGHARRGSDGAIELNQLRSRELEDGESGIQITITGD